MTGGTQRSEGLPKAGGAGSPGGANRTDLLLDLFREPLDPGYAQAARRRGGQPAPAGWRRTGARVARLATLVLVGLLLAVAYRQAVAAAPDRGSARAGLLADVRQRQAQTDELQRQADALRDEVARTRDEALLGSDDASRLRDLEARTGLGRVRGNGVVVRLADAPPPTDPVTGKPTGSNQGLVLDRDLQDVANALWRAGAEAIAVNGERLTATSTIRAAGNAILVDFRPVTGPYLVAAIGPEDIDRRFAESATAKRFRRYIEVYRMQFSVQRQADLTLPAATEAQLRFARPPGVPPSRPASGGPSQAPSGGPTPSGPAATGGGR
jgi:uncharacterized protein YlxW (UPF0749 family)